MEYYIAFKKELLPCATTVMNPGGYYVKLSKISETQKDKRYIISLICENKQTKSVHRNRAKQY